MGTTTISNEMETHGLVTKFIRIFSVPIMNHVSPEFLKKMMRSTSHDSKTVVQNTGTAAALDAMYTRHQRGLFSRGIMQGLADLFWHHCFSQPKALRNRLALVEMNMDEEILRLTRIDDTRLIKIISVGGGSMRALIQSINRISQERHLNIKVLNIDKDERAIDAGKKLAGEFDSTDLFDWIRGDARNLKTLISGGDFFDIAEMVGLLDYFSEESGAELIRSVYNILKPGGVFIVANVHPNEEMPFVTNLGWPFMYYREPKDLKKLLVEAGFSSEPDIIFEPLKVHIIAKVSKI